MWAAIGFMLVIGLVVKYWYLFAIAAALQWGVPRLRATLAAEQAHREALDAAQAATALRADQQHAWELAGDPRGTYGEYPPAA